jgi:hypothetical protein
LGGGRCAHVEMIEVLSGTRLFNPDCSVVREDKNGCGYGAKASWPLICRRLLGGQGRTTGFGGVYILRHHTTIHSSGSHSLRNRQPYLDLEQYLRQGRTRVPCWVLLSSIGIIVLWQRFARQMEADTSPHRILALHRHHPTRRSRCPRRAIGGKTVPGNSQTTSSFLSRSSLRAGGRGNQALLRRR